MSGKGFVAADIEGPDYPSETFRVLKKNKLRDFGEDRARHMVLEVWDKLQSKDLPLAAQGVSK